MRPNTPLFSRQQLFSPPGRTELVVAPVGVQLVVSSLAAQYIHGSPWTVLSCLGYATLAPVRAPIMLPDWTPTVMHWTIHAGHGQPSVVFTRTTGVLNQLWWGDAPGPFTRVSDERGSTVYPSFARLPSDHAGTPRFVAISCLQEPILCMFIRGDTSWRRIELLGDVERALWLKVGDADVLLFKRTTWGPVNAQDEMLGDLHVAVLDGDRGVKTTQRLAFDPVYDFDARVHGGAIVVLATTPDGLRLAEIGPRWSVQRIDAPEAAVGSYEPRIVVSKGQLFMSCLEQTSGGTDLLRAICPYPVQSRP